MVWIVLKNKAIRSTGLIELACTLPRMLKNESFHQWNFDFYLK
jgi:hypothetical protein